jgi:hypothetical protein
VFQASQFEIVKKLMQISFLAENSEWNQGLKSRTKVYYQKVIHKKQSEQDNGFWTCGKDWRKRYDPQTVLDQMSEEGMTKLKEGKKKCTN